ncbi:MAG: SEC-C domain-containing protein [Longimicrobiales bacterium]
MIYGARRNAPCWCGSGLKLKHCHKLEPRENPDRRRDVVWGLGYGLGYATLASIWALANRLVLGSEPTQDLQLGLDEIVLGYFLMGALSGVFLGVARPLTSRRAGAAGVGAAIAFLVFSCGVQIYEGPLWRWDAIPWLLVILVSCLMGASLGLVFWSRSKGSHGGDAG